MVLREICRVDGSNIEGPLVCRCLGNVIEYNGVFPLKYDAIVGWLLKLLKALASRTIWMAWLSHPWIQLASSVQRDLELLRYPERHPTSNLLRQWGRDKRRKKWAHNQNDSDENHNE